MTVITQDPNLTNSELLARLDGKPIPEFMSVKLKNYYCQTHHESPKISLDSKGNECVSCCCEGLNESYSNSLPL
jgi:hypothetical protein